MIPRIIEQQYLRSGLDAARNDVPGGHHPLIARFENFGMRKTSGGDDHDIGTLAENLLLLRIGIEDEADAAGMTLRHAPVDDAHHLAAASALGREAHLPTGLTRGLEDDDLMTSLGGDTGRLQ